MKFILSLTGKKKIIILILAIFVLIIGFRFLRKRGDSYNWVLVERGSVVEKVSVTGQIIPAKKIDLQFEIQGKIENINVQ